MTEFEIGYLAGFFDGEGCISLQKKKPTHRNPYGQITLQIIVTQKYPEPLRCFLPCGGIIRQRKDTAYDWKVSGSDALAFLQLIQPLIVLKRRKVGVAIEFQKLIKRRGGLGRGIRLPEKELTEREAVYNRFHA